METRNNHRFLASLGLFFCCILRAGDDFIYLKLVPPRDAVIVGFYPRIRSEFNFSHRRRTEVLPVIEIVLSSNGEVVATDEQGNPYAKRIKPNTPTPTDSDEETDTSF